MEKSHFQWTNFWGAGHPFVCAVKMQKLSVRNTPDNPLASIQDVRTLGNTGGGDLGDVLALFASGNHTVMLGPSGELNQGTPERLFSLQFPGSKGAHPGHSGILMGNPHRLDSGRFSPEDYRRLRNRANNQGFVTLSDVGSFIAENLHRDPESRVFEPAVFVGLARNLGHFVESVGPDLLHGLRTSNALSDRHRDLEQKLTDFTGEDNLVGSCGEFGLLFAFLVADRPSGRVNGEPVLLVEDLDSMFIDKGLPDGWDTWKKTRIDWLTYSTDLMVRAGRAYLAQPIGSS